MPESVGGRGFAAGRCTGAAGASATGCGRSSGTTTGPTIRGGTLGTASGTGAGAAAITFFVQPLAPIESPASTTAAVQPVRDGVRGGFNTLIGNGEKGGARLFGRQAAWGSRMVKVVPRPGVDCTSMCPSCSWIVR